MLWLNVWISSSLPSSGAVILYCDLHHIPRATMLQLATLGQWRHHTSHFSTTVTLERQLTIKKLWMNESHLHCHLFLHTILSFPSLLDITNSLHCKSRMCPQCAGYGWPRPYQPTLRLISRARHKQNGDFSLRPSAGTSKNVDTTFKHWDWNIKWAPAWWGTIYQGLKHLWRAAEIWKSFSPQSPVHCQDHQQLICM